MDIEAWDSSLYRRSRGPWRDLAIVGAGSITFYHTWPFSDPDGTSPDSAENHRELMQLLDLVIEVARPESLKLYDEDGWYFPVSARYAYFRDEKAVLRELMLLHEMWERGLPGCAVGEPVGKSEAMGDYVCNHDGRRPEPWRVVWERYSQLIPLAPQVTAATVRSVLAQSPDGGLRMTRTPNIFNSFAADAFLDVLQAVHGTDSSERP